MDPAYLQMLFIVGLAVAQLMLGIFCGMWLSERQPAASDAVTVANEASREVAAATTSVVPGDVNSYASQLDEASREIRSLDPADTSFGAKAATVLQRLATVSSALTEKLGSLGGQLQQPA